jgi:hypothetical protein
MQFKKDLCRCVDEETNCEGEQSQCQYPLGKKSYEEDI